jgi:nitrogen fixation/metabolism regulation signal transduction histidine kinase
MAFYRQFRTQYIIRVLLLSGTLALFFFLLLYTGFVATIIAIGLIALYQVYALLRHVEKTNQDLTRFFLSIKYADFSQSFTSTLKGSGYEELNAAFNEVIQEFQRTRLEKEEHFRYLQTIVDHVGVGLIAFNPQGDVELLNAAAKRLLHIPRLKNIRHLDSISRQLVESLMELPTGVNQVVKLYQDNAILQLSIYATGFILHQQHFKLVSMQNITSALEEKEMEAWQNLIRVLTHEIVNSITPIASLASTANDLLSKAGEEEYDASADVSADVHEAVKTIEKRSQGLLTFIENYRKLTRIPKPEFSIIPLQDLFARIRLLLHDQFEEQAISFQTDVSPETLEITADQALIEQALINLCKNALEAVSGREQPTVQLVGTLDEAGGPVIKVIDNGPGIKGELVENIFIPFFTTKPEGSGIGLSLSRQIMRAHKGTLSVSSTPDVETIFSLRF